MTTTFYRAVRDDGQIAGYFQLTEEEARPYADGVKRHSMVNGFPVAWEPHEEAERDVEEAEWAAGAPARELLRIEQMSGMDRGEREIAIKMLPPESARRKKAETAESQITNLKIRKEKQ